MTSKIPFFSKVLAERAKRKQIIFEEYQSIHTELKRASAKDRSEEWEEYENSKTVCPFCGGKEVLQRIGDTHGPGKATVFFRCKKCCNSWKPIEYHYESEEDVWESHLYNFYFYYHHLGDNISYNANDPDDRSYSSRKDKKKSISLSLKRTYFDPPSYIRNFHPETVKLVTEKMLLNYDFYNDITTWSNKRFYDWGCKKW